MSEARHIWPFEPPAAYTKTSHNPGLPLKTTLSVHGTKHGDTALATIKYKLRPQRGFYLKLKKYISISKIVQLLHLYLNKIHKIDGRQTVMYFYTNFPKR